MIKHEMRAAPSQVILIGKTELVNKEIDVNLMPVLAARVSHGQDGKTGENPERDEKLVKFLAEHGHTSPFEHLSATFKVTAPLYVAREWMRHRTQCMSGSSEIVCVMPNGTAYTRTIKQIFDLKYGGVEDAAHERRVKNGRNKQDNQAYTRAKRKVAGRTRVLPNCQERTLRVLNESTGFYETGRMLDVIKSGVKLTYKVTTDDGLTITATKDHKIYTKDGWKILGELTTADYLAASGKVATKIDPVGKYLRSAIGAWTSKQRDILIPEEGMLCQGGCARHQLKMNLQLDHIIPVKYSLKDALDVNNLRPVCKVCHRFKTNQEQIGRKGQTALGVKWTKITSVTPASEEETYDISMEGPWHNFVANGLVVHNSFNEVSMRYTSDFIGEVHFPSEWRGQDGSNRQVGSGALDEHTSQAATALLAISYRAALANYDALLALGVCREQARAVIPVGHTTHFYASGNLLNWARFCKLRCANDAQAEIRELAEEVSKILSEQYPMPWKYINN